MNRRQRMKNRETARRLRQWANAPTISISSAGVDLGAPGGDFSAVSWVQLGRVVNFHFTTGSVDFLPRESELRFDAVRITEGNAT